MNIERLYRIMQTPQWKIGEDLWTQTFLAVCRHLAQLYAELVRRGKAARARTLAQSETALERSVVVPTAN